MGSTASKVAAFNSRLVGAASGWPRVAVVDHYTGFDATRWLPDGIHPNALGDRFLARNWFDALDPLLLASSERPTRILPLGDSITEGCYRYDLWRMLSAAHPGGFDFVGTKRGFPDVFRAVNASSAQRSAFDADHSGRGGWTTMHLAAIAHADAVATQPDVVLYLAGTNDILQSDRRMFFPFSEQTAVAQVRHAVTELQRAAPNATVLVGQIPPIRDSFSLFYVGVSLLAAVLAIAAVARAWRR